MWKEWMVGEEEKILNDEIREIGAKKKLNVRREFCYFVSKYT